MRIKRTHTVLTLIGIIFFLLGCAHQGLQDENFLSGVSGQLHNRVPVDESIPNLTEEQKRELISIAYDSVDDFFQEREKRKMWPKQFDDMDNKVFVGFRVHGKKKGSWSAQKQNLARSVYVAVIRTLEDQRYDGSLMSEDVDDLMIEIFVLGDEKSWDENYEPGIHGVRVEYDEKSATYYNSVAIEKNYKTEKLLAKACVKAGFDDGCFVDDAVQKYYFPTLHFASTRFAEEPVTFYRSNIVDTFVDVTTDDIAYSLQLAMNWFTNNIKDNGVFQYQYSPSNGNYSSNNNMIRQMMASRLLAAMASEDRRYRKMHKKNLEFIFDHWYKEDEGIGYVEYNGRSKLGANGLALRTLVYSPYFSLYEKEAKKIAQSILSLQQENGSLRAFYIEPKEGFDEERLLTFYTGEAILGLTELYEKTLNTTYLNAAIFSQDYYVSMYVDDIEKQYYPAYVPWHTMSLYKLYKITKNERYRDAIFTLSDRLIQMQQTDNAPYPDVVGRMYDSTHPEYGIPFSGSTAIYVEGLVDAYALAVEVGDELRALAYKRAIVLGAHNLMNLQFKHANMYYLQHPERVHGAIRYRVDDNRIRIDTTQHAIDAFRAMLKMFNAL